MLRIKREEKMKLVETIAVAKEYLKDEKCIDFLDGTLRKLTTNSVCFDNIRDIQADVRTNFGEYDVIIKDFKIEVKIGWRNVKS